MRAGADGQQRDSEAESLMKITIVERAHWGMA